MKQEHITLRCDDGAEAVVFTKYEYEPKDMPDGIIEDIDYEICIEDSYIGGDYKGFFGRLKRAWQAFIDKPVVYTGIYSQDKEKMRKFLCDCLALVNDNANTNEEPFLKGLYNENGSVTSNEELIKEGKW